VLQAVADLGYYRDEVARAMIHGRLSLIGFAVPSVDREVIGAMMEGMLEAAETGRYFLKVIRVGSRSGADLARLGLQYRLAGMICSQLPDAMVEALHCGLAARAVPLVVVDNSAPAPWKPCVVSDDPGGERLAIEHLKALGHRRIAYCAYKPRRPWSRRRCDGFVDAMRGLGLDVRPQWVFKTMADDADWSEVVARFRDTRSRPTAVLCAGDPAAMVLIRSLRGIGLAVPRDVSVVGFADFACSRWCDPPLTTIRQPFREMGARAMRRLMEAIQPPPAAGGGQTPGVDSLPTTLVVRGSTAPPPGAGRER